MGMRNGMEVSWLPSYGPEMRSGSAHCHVCLSHERIGSPLISHPDVLIAMNEISLRKFAAQMGEGSTILYNRDKLPEDFTSKARVICLPASDLADKMGSTKVANVIMLGAVLEQTGCMPPDAAVSVIESTVKKAALLELNKQAIAAGCEFIKNGAVSQPNGFAY
jgi:2-oxoisovalerate ferredoxin oxidoreductase beta subunit